MVVAIKIFFMGKPPRGGDSSEQEIRKLSGKNYADSMLCTMKNRPRGMIVRVCDYAATVRLQAQNYA